eukprot:CAMPEP_0197600362 /NCGR_PEP_ID=MMETSP1326-20131121/33130_1 /TAXON_ID=1155430 /ORGANISM="Genus nov. species nov., Strain RCC2288" /LENGTH=54 /DNA_ID=CAMNT_0043167455 /DNA_START=95 /DNA_END=255 /DNA_ORIENTATION=-
MAGVRAMTRPPRRLPMPWPWSPRHTPPTAPRTAARGRLASASTQPPPAAAAAAA